MLSLLNCGESEKQSQGENSLNVSVNEHGQMQEGGCGSPTTGNLDVKINIVEQEVEVPSGEVILRVLDADIPRGGMTLQLPVMLYPDSVALPTDGDFQMILAPGLTLTNVTAGQVLRDANKVVYFNLENGVILFFGMNRTPIAGGELLILTIEVEPQLSNLRRVCISDATIANGEAEEVPSQTKCGTITEY